MANKQQQEVIGEQPCLHVGHVHVLSLCVGQLKSCWRWCCRSLLLHAATACLLLSHALGLETYCHCPAAITKHKRVMQ